MKMKHRNPVLIHWFFFLLLFIEGSSLMVVELIGAKFLAPFYGSSLYVWTSVLSITVVGLTLGYYFGGKLSSKHFTLPQLLIILVMAAVVVFSMPYTAHFAIGITSSLNLIPGIIFSSFLLLVPPMFLFGLVGPLVVSLLAKQKHAMLDASGTTYFVSTMGGIFATFLFGYMLIPEMGNIFSSRIVSFALVSLPLIYMFFRSVIDLQQNIIEKEDAVTTREHKTTSNTPALLSNGERITNSIYFFAVIEGSVVMCIELISARMLAPFYGSSLYVWVSVIGITLFSLAVGYFLGGRLASKSRKMTTIYWVLLLASIFMLLMHLTGQFLVPAFGSTHIKLALIIVSIILLVPPLLFMGMIPTLLISFVSGKNESSVATGRVFALSSASGIIVMPILGFLIIPAFGLRIPSIAIGLLVGIYPFFKLISLKQFKAFAFVLALIFSIFINQFGVKNRDIVVQYYSEGLLGQILVADATQIDHGKQFRERTLWVNRKGQSRLDLNSNTSRMEYIHYANSVASKFPKNSSALVLGLGGGSIINMFEKLQYKVDVVDIDKRIWEVARDYFSLDSKANILIDDARHYIETTSKKYDIIFYDVFNGDVLPSHVLNKESFNTAKLLLNPGGIIILNYIGVLTGEDGRSARSIIKTMKATGMNVNVMVTQGGEAWRNSIIIASPYIQDFSVLREPVMVNNHPIALSSLFLSPSLLDMENARVLIDDNNILDKYNIAIAEKTRQRNNWGPTKKLLNGGVPLFK